MEECDVIPCYFITVKPDDVLLGRGAPIINNEGNVRFRKIVAERKDEYKASCRHQLKNAIAKEIIDEIVQKRNGRFLRMADAIDELKEKGRVPNDAKSAWVIADDMVIMQKVKQALRELDDTPISTTSSNENKRKKAISPTTTSPTITSTSKRRKRNEDTEEDINVLIESKKDSNKQKNIKALGKARTTSNTLSMKNEPQSSQKHGEGDELDTADTITSLAFSLNQHDKNHNLQLEISHKMSPVSKNHPCGSIEMNNVQKHQQSLLLEQPNIRNNHKEGILMQDHIHENSRMDQLTRHQNLPHQMPMRQSDTMRQSEIFIHELMNIKKELHDGQSNETLHEQNQHMLMFPKVVDKSITNNDMKSAHQIDNFQRRMSLIPDQSNEMMALKQHGRLDQNSLVSADELFLRRQHLLYVQQDQEQKTMLLQHQLQQQQEQHQLLQLQHQNFSHNEINASAWRQDTVPMSNATFLESDLHLNNPHQRLQSYPDNTLNAYELLELREKNAMNQYQLQLQQQEYLSNLFPSVQHSSSSQEIRFINDRNDFTVEQQQSIQQDVMPIQFINQMNLNHGITYQNYPLYPSQLPDSANDRIMTSSLEPNVTDSYLNHAGMQSLRNNNEDDKIDDEQIAAFKKFLERENAL